MDAIDILGALLGRKTQQGGSGGQILKDQLGGNRPAAPSTSTDSRRPQRPMTVEESAKNLEDLLNVATDQQASRRQTGDAEIDFLRKEFSSPLNVRELAWSIPLGMEDQAYAISLIAINLDEQSEAQYLGELAHGLRLTPDRCNEIHRQYGAPEIFR